MKKLYITVALLYVSTALLSGCGPSREPLSKRVTEVVDLGAMPLPNSGDRLHGYRVVNAGSERDHFVYVVERNGIPFAGTSTNEEVRSGKSSYNLEVTSVVEDSAPAPKGTRSVQVKCSDQEHCARIAAVAGIVR
jgi:hypothetical protein